MDALPQNGPTEPRSRRDRPAKPPLSRAAIVDAALDLVRREGIEAVTLRRVASLLDTGPASLYVYVANREELLARMLDAVLSRVPLPRTDPARWQDQLVELFTAVLDALDRHPGLAQAALGLIADQPGGLAVSESALDLLRTGEVGEQAAAWAYDALLLYTTATAVEHAIERRRVPSLAGHKSPDVDYAGAARARLQELPADRYPNLSAMAQAMTSGDDAARFEFALRALIGGARGL